MALQARKSEVCRRWDDGFVIRQMRQDDGQQVIQWFSALTTMSCDLTVALRTREEDTDGFYVGKLNDKMVASAVEVAAADDVRYIGCVYVDEQHRKLGFAHRMVTTAEAVGNCHNSDSIVALDTHPYLELMYEKFDFKTVYKSLDYQGTVSACADCSRFGTNVREVQSSCATLFCFVRDIYNM